MKRLGGGEATRGRMIERVIANDCRFHCSPALRHSRGSDRHNLFLCKCLFRGSHLGAPRIFSLSSRLGGSRLNFSDSLAFLAFHPPDSSRIHLDYSSSTGYYSAGSEACASRRGADSDSRATYRRMPEGPSELGGWKICRFLPSSGWRW